MCSGNKLELKFAKQILPTEEVVDVVTQHTQPDWLDKFKKNIAVEVQKCSSRTKAAFENDERIEVFNSRTQSLISNHFHFRCLKTTEWLEMKS